jgi:hypothetical protein
MKYLDYILSLPLFIFLAACYGTDNKTDDPDFGNPVDDLTKNSSAKITHEAGWTIVSRVENGDHIYWFLAPEVNDVSPAMFKKIVYARDKSVLDTKTVSQCDAPKQTCDDLMKEFKKLSERYK